MGLIGRLLIGLKVCVPETGGLCRGVCADGGDGLGAQLACLVNASATVCGDDAIYVFGGFDQYTDEGGSFRESETWGGELTWGSL